MVILKNTFGIVLDLDSVKSCNLRMVMKEIIFDLYNQSETVCKQMQSTGQDVGINFVEGRRIGDRLKKIWIENKHHTFLELIKNPAANLHCYKEMQHTFTYNDASEEHFEKQTCFWLGLGEEELTKDRIDKLDGFGRHGIGFIQLIVATLTEVEKKCEMKKGDGAEPWFLKYLHTLLFKRAIFNLITRLARMLPYSYLTI